MKWSKVFSDIYDGVASKVYDVDRLYLGGVLHDVHNAVRAPVDDALDGLLHPSDEVGHAGRGIVDGLTGGALSAWDDTQRVKDYLENTGMDWSDIKYPSQSGAGSMGTYVARAGSNFVSKNIGRLYK